MITGPYVARQLSRVQIEYLLNHIDGPQRVNVANQAEESTRQSLLKKDLIRFTNSRWQFTVRTKLGREVTGHILGDWADALTRWGYGYGLETRDKERMIDEHADRYRPTYGNPRNGKFAHRRPRGLTERSSVHAVPVPMWLCEGIDHPVQQASHHDGANPPKE